ncbi:MAG TPA: hypothetical protein VJL85_07285 [Gaiellaceae bacterium]|nr:hypothetical protein [Gaiellaceae bacterium]
METVNIFSAENPEGRVDVARAVAFCVRPTGSTPWSAATSSASRPVRPARTS